MSNATLRHPERARQGFTLIEALLVVALIGIVSAMAYSGWKRVMWRVQSVGGASELRDALMLARSAARTSQSHVGVFFDPPNRRFLRFLDSSGSDLHDGRYVVGERVLQGWKPLPAKMLFHQVNSSIAPSVPLRPCGGTAVAVSPTVQSGTFSVVFRPSGQSMATFSAKLGVESFPKDTFRIEILPSTGLVTMERR